MRKVIVSICLCLGGLAIFVLGSPYYSVFPTNKNLLYCGGLTVFFLAVWFILKRNPAWSRYALPAYGLFVASAATLFLSTGLLNLWPAPSDPVLDITLDKIGQFMHVVPVIILLTLVARQDLRSIFIARGNLKTGLIFGVVSFLIWALLFYLLVAGVGTFHPSAGDILLLLVWCFANSFMEELWFRAIFLKGYGPLIGRLAAVLVTSVVFGVSHVNAAYEFPGGGVVLGSVVFVLGVVGAWSMYKTDSLIGAVLFHAGYDLMIIMPVLDSA